MEPNEQLEKAQAVAVQRCEMLISHYDGLRNRHRLAYHGLLVLSLVLSGITPILVLTKDVPPLVQSIPAAIASIATGVIAIFQWRENYPRCTYVTEALRSEKYKYLTRTTKDYDLRLTEHQALTNFVSKIEGIVLNEITDWRHQVTQTVEGEK